MVEVSLVEMAVADVGEHVKHGAACQREQARGHEIGHDFQHELGPAIRAGEPDDSAREP